MFLIAGATASNVLAGDDETFLTLYKFEAPAPNTFTSPLGSQPDTRPVLGPGNTVYGMTSVGGANANGVIYRFDLESRRYTVLHTFSALDANGNNEDGAVPGVALTRGPDDLIYGMASFGGANGTGTVFKITTSGDFTVLHTFSALDANGNNEDGAYPLRTIVVGRNGKLYGTTRLGGENICGPTHGCGVAWVMDRSGNSFNVLHQFTGAEGHAASLLLARDGLLYGCAVWPATSLPSGAALPSGILYRMAKTGDDFDVLYTFGPTNALGQNSDGADCYEPLAETKTGVFYGAATRGGTNGNGVLFRYSLSNPGTLEIVHDFSAVNTAGENSDGASPSARLSVGKDGTLYSTASFGGANGNGLVYRICPDGDFDVLHTFSAANPTTGANQDGAIPDFGVVLRDDSLIGIAAIGGNGSTAGFFNSGGTLYQLKLWDFGSPCKCER
ncbi:MAG TPA: choice-of-anchor tandem repeat GloVer-containing protein [Bryobacteraceae bacterium]|nr:choice-of-anchor tandem repeat GloVer-containing protein [Bryobacteraceae bacterium]